MCKTVHEVRSYSLLPVKKLADGMNMMKICTSVTDRNQERRKKLHSASSERLLEECELWKAAISDEPWVLQYDLETEYQPIPCSFKFQWFIQWHCPHHRLYSIQW
jgi:hypothetical protein